MAFPTNSLDLELGSSERVSVADTGVLDVTTAFTIEGWVNFETLPSTSNVCLASKGTSTGNQRGFNFYFREDSGNYNFRLQLSGNGSSYGDDIIVNTTAITSTGVWYHVRCTYDGGATAVKFYVNEAQVGTTQTPTVTSIFNNTGAFGFGADNISGTPGSFLDGKLSLWRYWSTVQTSNNKCTVYASAHTGMIGEWTFDSVLTDGSGNGLTLSHSGSPTYAASVPGVCASSNGGVKSTVWFM